MSFENNPSPNVLTDQSGTSKVATICHNSHFVILAAHFRCQKIRLETNVLLLQHSDTTNTKKVHHLGCNIYSENYCCSMRKKII